MFKIEPKSISMDNLSSSIDKWEYIIFQINDGEHLYGISNMAFGQCGFCREWKKGSNCNYCPLGACIPTNLGAKDISNENLLATYEATGNPFPIFIMHCQNGNQKGALEAAKEMLEIIKTFEPYVY